MKKRFKIIGSMITLLFLMGFHSSPFNLENETIKTPDIMPENACIIGKWKYVQIINMETKTELDVANSPLNGVTMEFRNNETYIQSMNKASGFTSTKKGIWKFDGQNQILTRLEQENRWVQLNILDCNKKEIIFSNGRMKLILNRG